MTSINAATLENLQDPDSFYNYVNQLLDTNLPLHYTDLITSNQSIWVTVLLGLSRFMVFPPISDALPWSAFARKVEMAERWMELVERASTRIVGLYLETGNLAHEVLTKLLDVICAFDAWNSHEDYSNASHSPSHMKQKALRVMLVVARVLGNSISNIAPTDGRLWQTLRVFLVESIDVIRDYATRPSILTPTNIRYFKDTYTSETDVPIFDIKLHSPLYLNGFLVSGLEAVTQTLSLRLRFTNALPFYKIHGEFCGPLRALPYRLLQFCLRETRLSAPDDMALRGLQDVIPSDKADVSSALECLRSGCRDEARPVIVSFLRDNMPFADSEALVMMKDALAKLDLGMQREVLLSELNNRLESLVNSPVSNDAKPALVGSEWRRKVLLAVEEIYVPECIIWTDEEEGAPDNEHPLIAIDRVKECVQSNALGAVVQTMCNDGENIEPIFDRLYCAFDNARIPGKETLIISVGLMGK
ncbi:hypothetical protein DXG03_000092 [Asterophora parasitica]|uniref:Uncharacterized protein n=1 Tax=Asterophora parasitica TaxID=117018 RepID=A0A9P7GK27_9AGAR|nr:hypothetical protein DXG03_000092 [Asterophora parasitica]